MKSSWLRILSTLLVIALLINMLPMSIFAEEFRESIANNETVSEDVVSEDTYVISEITEKRTEYSKEFLLSNGLHMATVYADPVHYKTDNGWEEIDNTLKTNTDGTYTNTEGIWDVSLPQELSDGESVTIEKDGYTLSFSLTGELNTSEVATYGRDGVRYDIKGAKKSHGRVQKMDWEEMRQNVEFEEMVPKKSKSRLTYTDVYENTDIIYDLNSNTVKESIVLESYSDTLQGYTYALEVGTMIPVLEEDGQITLYDKDRKNIVMVMPAPYLVDDTGVYNYDIEVQLTGSGSTYTLTYLLPTDWLASDDRTWPVVLDPAVMPELTTKNIRDDTVFQFEENQANSPELDMWYHTWGVMHVGYSSPEGISRAYLKYDKLPSITSSDVVIGAYISMISTADKSGKVFPVEVHKVMDTWESESLTWANKPDYNSNIEDYALVNDSARHDWDITDIVRGWYSGKNTGMMFKLSNAYENAAQTNYKQFISSDYYENDTYQPLLVIYFRNNNGLENYWDYTTSTAGRAGTGYVNNFTGNMTFIHNDIGFSGNRMPVSINHIYNLNDAIVPSDSNNSNDSGGNSFGMGIGWRTNYNQLLYQWSVDNDYYVWEDSDGTDHYFTLTDGKLQDEDGLELTLTTTGSGSERYCITDKDGNCSYFDTSGRLTKMTNNQKTKSNIAISYYSTTRLITRITDGAGRKYDFYYTDGMLTKISYTGTGSTEISSIQYAYNNDLTLKSITYADGKTSTYSYTNKLLKTATDIDGYALSYTYSSVAESWQPYRTLSVSSSDGSAKGGSLTFTYEHNQTTVTDYHGNVEILQFNNLGNLTCIMDDEGRAQYAQYAKNTDDDAGKANQLALSSELQYSTASHITGGAMRSKSGWSITGMVYNFSVTTLSSYRDTHSLYIGTNWTEDNDYDYDDPVEGPHGIYTTAGSLAAGKTQTFSCYVKPTTASVYLMAKCGDSVVTTEATGAGTSWKRLQVSYTNDTNTAQKVRYYILTESTGEFFVDCAQLELAHTATRYNMINNGDFNCGKTTGWTASNCASADGITTLSAPAADRLDSTVIKINGDPQTNKRYTQTVYAKGKEGYTYVLAGWGKGNAAPTEPVVLYESDEYPDRGFSVQAVFNYSDGTTSDPFIAQFNTDTDQWQYSATAMVAKKAFSSITVSLVYSYNVNTAYFDGIQLFRDEFGDCYTYDDDGNVVSVVDTDSKKHEYKYTANNLTQEIIDGTAEMTYTYDDYHNVKTATTKEGVVYTFEYDDWGNNTSVSIDKGEEKLVSSATYTSDGNHLVSTTDAMGQVTSYGYNSQTGVLDWVQYPEDTEDTRTEYTYDSMYRMATAACETDAGNSLSAAYTYTDDLLTKIQTGSTTYNFTYGNFGLRTAVKVGDHTLATYHYNDETVDDRKNDLDRLDYANGDRVQYEYNEDGKVTKRTYEDGTYVTYQYDDNGFWTSNTDSATGITTTYTYDLEGRLRLYEEEGEGHSYSLKYSYTDNKLTYILELINGYDRGTRYTYDEDDRLISVKKANSKRTYNYDDLNRVSSTVTSHKDEEVLTTNYSFVAPTGNTNSTTSGQISTITHTAAGYNSSYSYTYDKNGNILTVSDGTNTTSYAYDTANQLIRENNQAGNYTYVWEYDNAGNILSRTEYAYTTEENLDSITPTDTVTYTYGAQQWDDMLTNYDGTFLDYDDIGNLTDDGTWEYTWQHGRQLASMSDGTTTWNYTYNADGMRTKRTNGTNTYEYVYSGSELVYMSVDGEPLRFSYAAEGTPMSVIYKDCIYFYVTNQQGDVVALLSSLGNPMVEYTYDAWGNLLSTTGIMAATLGAVNPLRYRGYIYDQETGLYYLQSRYYNPEIGRFINADGLVSTGQGLLSYNMFAYCGNNPVSRIDLSGCCYYTAGGVWAHDAWENLGGYVKKPDPGYYQGTTPTGLDVYVATDDNYSTPPNTVKAIDRRDTNLDTEGNHNPDIQIINSYRITERADQVGVLTILNKFNNLNPSEYKWNRTQLYLLIEWDMHNFFAFADQSARDVDFDNNEEGCGYIFFVAKAVSKGVKKHISSYLPFLP